MRRARAADRTNRRLLRTGCTGTRFTRPRTAGAPVVVPDVALPHTLFYKVAPLARASDNIAYVRVEMSDVVWAPNNLRNRHFRAQKYRVSVQHTSHYRTLLIPLPPPQLFQNSSIFLPICLAHIATPMRSLR